MFFDSREYINKMNRTLSIVVNWVLKLHQLRNNSQCQQLRTITKFVLINYKKKLALSMNNIKLNSLSITLAETILFDNKNNFQGVNIDS